MCIRDSGYFDNMNAFFGNNGYRIVDRTAAAQDDITFVLCHYDPITAGAIGAAG